MADMKAADMAGMETTQNMEDGKDKARSYRFGSV